MKIPGRKTRNPIARALHGRLDGGRGKTMAAAGIVAVAAAGAAAARLLRNRAGATVLHVQSAEDNDGWVLTRDGAHDPIERYPRKRQAVTAAREFARQHAPAVLNIHRTDGSLVRSHAYESE